jgi:ATP-dependent Clp protease ATP-binding subunit ClpA
VSEWPLSFARLTVVDYNSAMSWFDEAEELLEKMKRSQEANDRYWSKFTPRAHQVLSFANKEARETKASCIGVEHLLVGLLGAGGGLRVLRDHGLTPEVVRAEILKLNGGAADIENAPHYLHTTPG